MLVEGLQSMSWDCPEKQRQRRNKEDDQESDPDSTAHQKFADVRFSDAHCPEGGCFGLLKECEDGVEFVLVRYEAKDCDGEWYEELIKRFVSL